MHKLTQNSVHCVYNNGCTNAPQNYVIRTVFVLSLSFSLLFYMVVYSKVSTEQMFDLFLHSTNLPVEGWYVDLLVLMVPFRVS